MHHRTLLTGKLLCESVSVLFAITFLQATVAPSLINDNFHRAWRGDPEGKGAGWLGAGKHKRMWVCLAEPIPLSEATAVLSNLGLLSVT